MTAVVSNTNAQSRKAEIHNALMAAKARRAARNGQGKSLNEEVKEIMTKNSTKAEKRADFIKLGLTSFDIEWLLNTIKEPAQRSKFTFGQLTFGVEIECYHAERNSLISACNSRGIHIESQTYNHRDSKTTYKIVSDASLSGENNNEVVSPILRGNRGLDSLQSLCNALAAVRANVNRSCGLHVHIGATKMTDDHFIRIVKNYQMIEKAVDSMMPRSRRDSPMYCKTLQGIDLSNVTTKRQLIQALGTRYRKVNAHAFLRHQTIEFRQHSGTVEYEKIMHWLKFVAALVQYSYNNEIHEEVTWVENIPFLKGREQDYYVARRDALR